MPPIITIPVNDEGTLNEFKKYTYQELAKVIEDLLNEVSMTIKQVPTLQSTSKGSENPKPSNFSSWMGKAVGLFFIWM